MGPEIMTSIDKLLELIANALEIELELLDIDSSAETIDAWDSIGHLTILGLIEDANPGILDLIPDLATAYSVQSITNLIKQKH